MFAEFGVLNFWTYVVGAFFIVLVPGPNTLFVLKTGIGHGVKKGYLAATGVFIGDAVLMFLAWAGVAALIQTTPVLFNIVRYLGAFYLLWLGGKMLWSVITRQNNAHVTRTAEWRIVPKVLAVEPLTLKSGSAAPRSPVNNCGKLTAGGDSVMTPTPSEQAAAVLNLIERGVIGWNEPDVVKVLNGALKAGAPRKNRQQRSNAPLKTSKQAPSARMTKPERDRVAKIRFDLAQEGITPERWELDALARGATVIYGDQKFKYPVADGWPGDSTQMEWAL